MREFNFPFQEGLVKGLRAYPNNPYNEQALIDLYNARVGSIGPEGYHNIVNLGSSFTIAWPFPQVFLGSKYCFIAERTKIHNIGFDSISASLNIENSDSVLDELGEAILDELSEEITWSGFESLINLPTGGFWDYADFGAFVILSNGSTIAFIDHATDPANPAIGTMASSSVFPRCRTYCNFKGQIIGGNVQSSWHDCDESSVIWSKIGSADFTPSVSMEAGYKVMSEFTGVVHKVKRFAKGFVIYGANGIVYAEAMDWNLSMYKGLPFGFYEISNVGIPSIKAVSGDDKEHVFVDNLSRIWRWVGQEPPKELGYVEYMEQMDLVDIVVSFDPGKRDYYIADGNKGFLLSPFGLSEIHQLPTSLLHYGGKLYGIAESNNDEGFVLETDVIDFKNRGHKTLVTVELGAENSQPFKLSVGWKSNNTGTFAYSPIKLVNPNGVAYPRVTADDFRIKVTSTSSSGLKFSYMNIRGNMTDIRSVRGRLNVDSADV